MNEEIYVRFTPDKAGILPDKHEFPCKMNNSPATYLQMEYQKWVIVGI